MSSKAAFWPHSSADGVMHVDTEEQWKSASQGRDQWKKIRLGGTVMQKTHLENTGKIPNSKYMIPNMYETAK